MSQNVDRRVRRTLTLIRDAFVALIVKRGFEAVTVRDICRQAGINRATFYRHYRDKFDLADRLGDVLFPALPADLPPDDPESLLRSTEQLFAHVADYALFYRAMLGPGGIPGFRDRIQQVIESQMGAQLDRWGYRPEAGRMPAPLPLRYLAAAQAGFVQWWLENEMPFPPAEAAVYLLQLHERGALWALGLADSD